MSRIVRFHETGGPEVLKVEDVAVPAPKAGEVQIRVKAMGLNRAEVMFRTGQYVTRPTFPAILGYEAAGTVEAVGPTSPASRSAMRSASCPASCSVTTSARRAR